jgi:hypothetical protein
LEQVQDAITEYKDVYQPCDSQWPRSWSLF